MIYLSKLKKLVKQHKFFYTATVALSMLSQTDNALAYSLDDALISAHESNYSILADYERQQSTKLETPKAYTGFLPTVSGAISNTKTELESPQARANQTKEKVNVRTLTVNQPIFKGGETFANIKIAENSVEAGQHQFKAVSNDISLKTVSAYEGVLNTRDIYDLNTHNETVLAENLKLTQTKFKHGEVTKTDVLQAESRHSTAIAEKERAYGEAKAAEALFVRIIGAQLPESLDPISLENVALPETFEELLEIALKNNPSLQSRKYNAEASKYGITKAYSVIMPKVSASAQYRRSDLPKNSSNTTDSDTYTINLNVPIFQSGAEYADIFKSQHQAKKDEYDYKEVERQIRENAVRVWNNYKVSQAVIKSSEEAIQAAQKALDGVREEAKAGTRTTLDILNAQQEVFTTKVRKRSATKDLVESVYSILQLMGSLNAIDIVETPKK